VPERKALQLQLPADAPPGSVTAIFSTFDVLDKQRDIVKRAAFAGLDGAAVPLVQSHEWDAMPVGLGHIHVTPHAALFDGRFHLATQFSRDAYETAKAMAGLQEYSYGFKVAEDGFKEDTAADGGPVRVITEIERVYEVSLVLVGAGEGTRTVALKHAADLAAEWTTAYINNLPDSAFAYIEPGGEKDGEGKTVPRSLRHFPHHDAGGSLDLAHLRNALARAPQSPFGAKAMPHLERHARGAGVGEHALGDLVRLKRGMRLSAATRAELETAITVLQALLGDTAPEPEADGLAGSPPAEERAQLAAEWAALRRRYPLGGD